MTIEKEIELITSRNTVDNNHKGSNYFDAIKLLVTGRSTATDATTRQQWQDGINHIYRLVENEILTNTRLPQHTIKFGTSGWRGTLGKDLFVHSVAAVTAAILSLYREAEGSKDLRDALGINNFAEMQQRGCVVGFDNRFGGPLLALAAVNVLAANGVTVFYAGEAT